MVPKKDGVWVDTNRFNENMSQYPLELLRQHFGRCVAWDLEGKTILTSGADYDELGRNLDALGIASEEAVLGYVPGEDEIF